VECKTGNNARIIGNLKRIIGGIIGDVLSIIYQGLHCKKGFVILTVVFLTTCRITTVDMVL